MRTLLLFAAFFMPAVVAKNPWLNFYKTPPLGMVINPWVFTPVAGGSREFNGSSAYISAASSAGNSGSSARTVAMWVKTTNVSTRQFFYYEGDDTPTYNRFSLELGDPSGKLVFNYYGAAIEIATTIVANTWYHVAVTYDSSQAALYLNGSIQSTATVTLTTATTYLNFGRFYSGALYFSGNLAQIAKWNVALSGANITSLYGGALPSTISSGNLAFYVPLTGGVIVDTIGALSLTDHSSTNSSDTPP